MLNTLVWAAAAGAARAAIAAVWGCFIPQDATWQLPVQVGKAPQARGAPFAAFLCWGGVQVDAVPAPVPGWRTHLCPPDDLPVGLVLGAVEYLHAGYRFHGFAINRAHNAAKGREKGELWLNTRPELDRALCRREWPWNQRAVPERGHMHKAGAGRTLLKVFNKALQQSWDPVRFWQSNKVFHTGWIFAHL